MRPDGGTVIPQPDRNEQQSSLLPLGRRGGGYYQAACEHCDFYEDGDESAREKGRRHAAQNPGHRVYVDISRSLTYETGLTHNGR